MINLSEVWQYEKLKLKGCWHLAYYISSNRAHGTLADKLIKFKDGHTATINAWAKWASDELIKTEIKFDYIIRALGSKEVVAVQGKPCALLGAHLANKLNAQYIPWVIKKTRETKPLHTLRTYPERFNELHGVYFVADDEESLNNKNVLIIDDVTTTNCTIAEMQRALTEKWPSINLYLFCLGKTEYNITLNDGISMEYFI